MMIIIRDVTQSYLGLPSGTWRKALKINGQKIAVMACPHCGQKIALDGIDRTGKVSNPVKCDNPYCKFNDDVTLGGWDGRC